MQSDCEIPDPSETILLPFLVILFLSFFLPVYAARSDYSIPFLPV